MMRNHILLVVLVLLFSGLINNLLAQKKDPSFITYSNDGNYVELPFNVSLVPGVSIGGKLKDDLKVNNHISLNIFYGRAANLKGIEYGYGINSYTENVMGGQAAGIANIIEGDVIGVQYAGIFNRVHGDHYGAQASGIFNDVDGKYTGAQFAGICNKSRTRHYGFQGAFISNRVNGDLRGAQYSGIVNIVRGDVRGAQVAGIINKAGKVRGAQIGLINIADEQKGVPVGLVSYVKNVGLHYDLWMDEVKFVNLGLRSGNKYFHNIFKVGIQAEEEQRLTVGWNFAGHLDISRWFYMELDAGVQHVNESTEKLTNHLNMLSKIRLITGFQMGPYSSIYAGATLNHFVSEKNDGSELAPWTTDSTVDDEDYFHRVWPGFIVGVRF